MNPLDARRRLLGRNVYKKTVEGNPAIAQGSLARRYPGITMQGWTEQNGTPTPEAPVPIVSAGTQNQDTGKWEYEITIANEQTDPDKNQTVILTSDRPLTKWDRLEKRNGVWGWVYKSAEIVLDGSEEWTPFGTGNVFYCAEFTNLYRKYNNPPLCNMYQNKSSVTSPDSDNIGFSIGEGAYIYSLWIKDERFLEVDDFKSWLSFQYQSQTPVIVYAETAEETFVPLSESEQKAMNALYTFRPTTVLSNDCECNMSLTYKTKKSMEVSE